MLDQSLINLNFNDKKKKDLNLMIIFKCETQKGLLGIIKKKMHEANKEFKKNKRKFIKFIIRIFYVR